MELKEALTFDDVMLLPRFSEITPPQTNVQSLLTTNIALNIPLLSSAMDRVTESKTAVALAQAGGIGVIHRNLSIEKQAFEVEKVKKSESGMILDPITVSPDKTVKEALHLKSKYGISGLPVIDHGKLVGILTNRDLRFEEDQKRPIKEIMTPWEKLIVGTMQTSMDEAIKLMHKYRIEKLPIIDENRNLKGLITIKDIQKSISFPDAIRDPQGRLRVGAAVGTGENAKKRISALNEVFVDFITIDTAHGDSKAVLEMVQWSKKNYPTLTILAGNIATAAAAEHLYEAGADAIKVGMGCGSICTTRMIAGVGVPQFSAIVECSKVAKKWNRTLIADGGIKYSGDIVKALAAGAHSVMVGSLLAGTDESPGEIVYYQGRTYKSYRGMGSIDAMKEGSRDRYGQSDISEQDLVPEGIEGMVPYRGPINQVLSQLLGGIRAGLGYLGCKNIFELQQNAEFVKITNQGLKESHVHDVFVVKEAPNYRPHA